MRESKKMSNESPMFMNPSNNSNRLYKSIRNFIFRIKSTKSITCKTIHQIDYSSWIPARALAGGNDSGQRGYMPWPQGGDRQRDPQHASVAADGAARRMSPRRWPSPGWRRRRWCPAQWVSGGGLRGSRQAGKRQRREKEQRTGRDGGGRWWIGGTGRWGGRLLGFFVCWAMGLAGHASGRHADQWSGSCPCRHCGPAKRPRHVNCCSGHSL